MSEPLTFKRPLPHTGKGPHHALIKRHVPHWLSAAQLSRVAALKAARLARPAWYGHASTDQHRALKHANANSWTTQNAVDRQLRELQDVYAFAEPLLKQAIQDTYHLDLDVRTTFLHLYMPRQLPWYSHDFARGVTTRNVSLLDAALHNFAQGETFEADSCYISQPDYRGHFAIKPLTGIMSIEQFKTLCRELDLGRLYQQHLKAHLLATASHASATLKQQVIASQKAALRTAAELARIKTNAQGVPDLSTGAYHVLLRALRGERGLMQFYQLNILDAALTGILLISADQERVTHASKLIAYIPHDPENPLKEYDSPLAFMLDLSRKLRSNGQHTAGHNGPTRTYRQFFSQFVDHGQRGHFFSGLDQRLYRIQWHQNDPLDPRPSWRESPIDSPNLQFSVQRIDADLWPHQYQQAFNKILNDGRSLAVPTADADSNARWAWWDNVNAMLSDLFNLALLVVTPFVPVLGELMMVYTAFQFTDEVVEGLVDLAEAHYQECARHFIAVAIDGIQLAALGAGGKIAHEQLFTPSPFVDALHPIQVADTPRLWNPDLRPYAQHDLRLPADAQPDAQGLHTHHAQTVLRLENRHYVVEHDAHSHTYRVKHPTRPDAYAPVLEHNGHGAWVHEGEHPYTWDGETLRRRLGPITDGLSASQVEQACTSSGTHNGALRQMYADRDGPAPLLVDSLQRLRLQAEVEQAPEQIRAGAPTELPLNWPAQTTSELPDWPTDKAIKVYLRDDLSGDALTYGAAQADEVHTLTTCYRDVATGKLPEQVVGFLSEAELQALLPAPLPETPTGRIQALREQLASELTQQQPDIFYHLYSTREALDSPHGRLLQTQFPALPKRLVNALLLRATPNELAQMTAEQRIPLRLKNLARELVRETQASHAYEGFYHAQDLPLDTERLVLNALRLNTDALGDLHLAIHERSPGGPRRCAAGPVGASVQRRLLRQADGRYRIHAPNPPAPQPLYDLFEALLRVVPPEKLDYLPGQGRLLKQWFMEQLQPPAERRKVLEPPTLRQADERVTQTLLQRPMLGAFRRWFRGSPPSVEERVTTLCPGLSQARVRGLVQHLETLEDLSILDKEEAEHRRLLETLHAWRRKPTQIPHDRELAAHEIGTREYLIKVLKACWEKTLFNRLGDPAGPRRGISLDLSGTGIGPYIRTLDHLPADFTHVTHLNLSGTWVGDLDMTFLDNFPGLRNLELADNQLTAVPAQLARWPELTLLSLRDNPIEWRPSDYEHLRQSPMLQALTLEGNTQLRVPPDLASLPDLRLLNLRRTRVDQWPNGLGIPRSGTLEMDLSNTLIRTVPEYPAHSAEARVIAHSWLDRSKLEVADEQRFVDYRRTAGIDPYRTAPAGGRADSTYWLENLSEEFRPDAEQLWNDLEHEHGSQGFFDVIKLLRPESFQTDDDEALFSEGRHDLTLRIFEVMIAIDYNPQFRERVFSLAGTPANCADAGAHLFNRIGVETLLENIRQGRNEQPGVSLENRLVSLARQSSRLDRVNALAHAEVRHRTAPPEEGGLGLAFGSADNQVDDVQVYLAYQTGLKTRLDLPWLSEHMVYRNTARVTDEALDRAYHAILVQENGDGLADGLLEQTFWSEYLHDTHPADYQVARAEREQAGSQLEDLQDLQREWASPDLSATREAELRGPLIDLADALLIPHSVVLVKEPLSTATMMRLYADIEHGYAEISRQLTRQALRTAGLLDREA
ncbi:C-terminal novel E3 ligase, LRR-interacting [Pseudomonas sp. ok272]|uniref:NEL-type E3 ubiquitin ligase domain-containing protein n=1 Tax=unclassified Pseudomonas TaxID=196821 RepID=UPI0008B64B89|nr:MULTISPECIES: NEL-type E3 ubiquitin ligase domain-containing protein [unclassified Pseudomonas]SEN14661.1 C-terminal novel E3 ligase, LRR-interacting [Pseudomonas sp. ok272]SFN07093.1 C-terminal novel E3 ligase, LRR-interacting [Pseudomonas sp. ok602]